MRKYFTGTFIIILLLVTFATLPRVDYTEPSVFFYFRHLSLLYHLSVLSSIIIAVFSRSRSIRLLATIVFSLLIILTPSILLVNPWNLDSYAFVAEPTYIERNGQLGDFHVLLESPALGLTFGPYLLITSIDPFTFLKIFQGLIAIIFPLLIYLIAVKMKISEKNSVIAPLLFISIMWPIMTFNRQVFSLTYYLTSWFLLSHLILGRKNRRFFLLLNLQIILMILSHPATPVFFIANLVSVVIIGLILGKLQSSDLKLLGYASLLSTSIYILWQYAIANMQDINFLFSMLTNLFNSLKQNPSEPSGALKIFAGYTPTYSLIINTRLLITIAVSVFGVLMLLILYSFYQSINKKILVLLAGWISSNLASVPLLLYAGLPATQRPALFTFISCSLVGAIVYGTLASKRKDVMPRKMKNIVRFAFLTTTIILPAMFIPIIKYSPLPFMFPTNREIACKSFLDLHWSGDGYVIYIDREAYLYSWLRYGRWGPRSNSTLYFLRIYQGDINPSHVKRSSFWITYRFVTRDAFWNNTPSYLSIVENLTLTLPETSHNKVYDCGWPEWILTPRSNATE